jgi:soluble lytic murein transglycosylase-like protein
MPELPGLTDRIVTSEAPQPRISGAEIAQPYEMLARGLDKLGEGLESAAIPLAEQAGSRAVTRDDHGNVQVEHAPIFGEAGKAYARAVKTGALAEADGAAQRADIELRTQFRDDPQGYLKASDSFKRKQMEDMTAAAGPEVGVALGRAIEHTTTQTYRGLLNESERLNLQRADSRITAGITSASNDAIALARQGGALDSKDMQGFLSKYSSLLDEKTNNPRLAYSKEQRDLDFQSFQGEIAGARNLYHVDQVYKTQGYAAAVDAAKDVLTNENYQLTPVQRQAFYSHAMGEIRANEAVRRQDGGEARAALRELETASQLGQRIEPNEVESVADAFRAAGNPSGVASTYAAFAHRDLHDDFGRLPLNEQTQFLGALKGASPYVPMIKGEAEKYGLDPELFARQLYKENQFQLIGVSSAGARGIAQFMPATAERYGVNPDDPKSAIPGAANYMGDLKRMFMGNTGLALAGYNWGEGNVQKWLSSGADPARVPQETRNYVKDITGQSIDAWAKGQQQPAVSGVSFLSGPGMASWLIANRSADVDDAATKSWKVVMDDFAAGKGGFPSAARINEVTDAARATGNVDLLARIGRDADIIDKVQRISQYPVAQQASIETELRRQLAAGTAGAGAELIEKQLNARTQAIQKGIEENPIATALANFPDKLKTPGPLTLQDPQQLIVGLKMRAQISQIAAANWQTGPLSALDSQDVAQVKSALTNPDPAVKAGIFGAISTLPRDVLGATLRKLGGNEPAEMAQAAAGSLMAKAPLISASIFRGQAALAADDRLKPEIQDKYSYFDNLDKALPSSIFPPEDHASNYATMQTMIRARYADLSAQKGVTKFEPDLLKQAVTDVTGGVLNTNNSGKIIAPVRGMSQAQFDAVLGRITDQDLAGVTDRAGNPVTARYLRNSAQLQSVEDGKYLVLLGHDPLNPVYAYQGFPPQKFILDLSNRAAAPAAR